MARMTLYEARVTAASLRRHEEAAKTEEREVVKRYHQNQAEIARNALKMHGYGVNGLGLVQKLKFSTKEGA